MNWGSKEENNIHIFTFTLTHTHTHTQVHKECKHSLARGQDNPSSPSYLFTTALSLSLRKLSYHASGVWVGLVREQERDQRIVAADAGNMKGRTLVL